MTNFTAQEERGRYEITAKGHATGEDPAVCAGISAILYSLAGLLDNMPEIKSECIFLDEGDAHFIFSGGAEARTAYDMTVIGIAQIAESYPGYILANLL